MRFSNLQPAYLRNFVFGVEDSLVSTVGLLSGIAIADVPRNTIILTGVVLIFVEAFSMAAGTFLSEYAAESYAEKKEAPIFPDVAAGIIMFFTYFIFGFIPLFPYVVLGNHTALWVSICLSLLFLLILGISTAKLAKIHLWKNGLRTVVLGGMAIGIGVLAGKIVSRF